MGFLILLSIEFCDISTSTEGVVPLLNFLIFTQKLCSSSVHGMGICGFFVHKTNQSLSGTVDENVIFLSLFLRNVLYIQGIERQADRYQETFRPPRLPLFAKSNRTTPVADCPRHLDRATHCLIVAKLYNDSHH